MHYVEIDFDLVDKIRERINSIEKQRSLVENLKKWLQLTSSLDVIEDSCLSVEYYCNSVFPEDVGGKYLYIYGLLQALFLEQDAANGISVSLFGKAIDWQNEYQGAFAVREIRNDVSGHPTNRFNGKTSIYLVRTSLLGYGYYSFSTPIP